MKCLPVSCHSSIHFTSISCKDCCIFWRRIAFLLYGNVDYSQHLNHKLIHKRNARQFIFQVQVAKLQIRNCTVEPKIHNFPIKFSFCFIVFSLKSGNVRVCFNIIFSSFNDSPIILLTNTIDLLAHKM